MKIRYKSYDNNWKYGKGLGIGLSASFGVISVQIYEAHEKGFTTNYDEGTTFFYSATIIGLGLWIVSTYMNKKKVALAKHDEVIKSIEIVRTSLINSINVEDETERNEMIEAIKAMSHQEVIALANQLKE